MSLLFVNPQWWLLCAVAITGIGIALLFALLYARRRSERLLGSGSAVGVRQAMSDAALFVALLLLALALLGPRIGQKIVAVSTAGIDVVILLDVSRSMLAEDVPPNRLARALRGAAELLPRLEPGDRAALAVYSGRGVLLTPLSPDAAALLELLPAINTDLITPGGSNLRDGVERALEAFDPYSERARVLVVLSDGESSQRSGDIGATSALRANTRVVAVALGSEIGTTIPDGGAALLDNSRRIVISHRRRAPLQKLADATGGFLFLADEWGAVDADALTREVRRSVNAATSEAAGSAGGPDWIEQRRTVPVILPFVALAFALLWFECARPAHLPHGLARLRDRLRAKHSSRSLWLRRKTLGKVAVSALLPLTLLGAANETEHEAAAWEALARVRPLADSELLRLGVARARAERSEEAASAFRAVALGASDQDLAAIAYHDLGVLALERGDFQAARDAFLDALALVPSDNQSRFNLEWTLNALAVQPPPVAPKQASERDDAGEAEDDPESRESPDGPTEPDGSAGPEPANSPPPTQATPDSPGSQSAASNDLASSKQPDPGATAEADEADEATEPPPPESDSAKQAIASAPPLDPGQREAWLQRVQDDPARALHSAVAGRHRKRSGSEQTW